MCDSIPKIIHYCWFGFGEKPKYVEKYIKNWREKLPDYEIMEWNETNFDINYCKYVKEAYELKKYAFVSDVARLYALYLHGGIYLDTDVEVLKNFDTIIEKKHAVFGFEIENRIATSFMATTAKNEVISKFLKIYDGLSFKLQNNDLNLTPNVEYLTRILKDKGLRENGHSQVLDNKIYIYSKEYFSPYDYINCINEATENSYCIHHFAVSWLDKRAIFNRKVKSILVKIIGKEKLEKMREIKNKRRGS